MDKGQCFTYFSILTFDSDEIWQWNKMWDVEKILHWLLQGESEDRSYDHHVTTILADKFVMLHWIILCRDNTFLIQNWQLAESLSLELILLFPGENVEFF